MSNLKHPSNPNWSFSRKKLIKWTLNGKSGFADHEIEYLSKRFPVNGLEDDMEEAIVWAKKFGHRDRMAEVVCEHGTPQDKTIFAYTMTSYEDMMKESIESAQGAYVWTKAFPKDKDEMRPMIQEDEWIIRWAQDIGDKDEMKSRINLPFYERMFERKVEEKDVNLATG